MHVPIETPSPTQGTGPTQAPEPILPAEVSGYRWERIFYRCVTQVHVGVGQDVGIVDLPIARERATGLPTWFGSGLRGPLRARIVEHDPDLATRLFGPSPEDKPEDRSGCVSVVDAKLLLFPVRCPHQIFRWVTCPWVLERYR